MHTLIAPVTPSYSGSVIERAPSLRERIIWKLFPEAECPVPIIPDCGNRDLIVQRTLVRFSWADRIKILLGARMLVETKTITENEVGQNATASVASAGAPGWVEGFAG